jgi:hypothetical protein
MVTATIELDGFAGPAGTPEGRIVADGAVFEFHGWLGLSIALEEAIEAAEHSPPLDADDPTPCPASTTAPAR